MKWGRRKKRVAVESNDIQRAPQQQAPRKPRRMSNRELQARINRLRLEQELSRLESINAPEKKNRVEQLVKAAGTIATITGSVYTTYNNIDKIMKLARRAS